MAKHIGIVACSAEGAALCYRALCKDAPALMGRHAHPEITMHSYSLADYMECIDRDDWNGVGQIMLSSASKLATTGASFIICPDNTIHKALPLIEARSPLPWLHIAESVTREAVARGARRVGITGTRWLMESEVYPEKLAAAGIASLLPEPQEREEINRIIMDELIRGRFTPQAVAFFQKVIARMKTKGCDAVVLGCTEIPLLLHEESSPLPTLDSTRLLARAALRYALEAATPVPPLHPLQSRSR